MSETFINYSDLDFKQEDTDKYTVITFKDKEIKVLKYLPSIEKYSRREGAVRHDIPVPPCERGPARLNP